MAFPVAPVVPMTAAQYAALPEDGEIHYELQDGVLVPMPGSIPEHQMAISEFEFQMRAQLPAGLRTVQDVDVDLQIVPAHRPGFVRRPDLAVVTREGIARRKAEGGILRASEMVLAVEFLSDGSVRTDQVIKRGEYADAGIGHYWMVDLEDGPSLVVCHLAGDFGYQDAAPARGVFVTDVPFPVRIDLDTLLD